MSSSRDLEVVLYGATGFTGRQTVAYFARHAPPGLRWAIAARSRAKLEIVRAEAGLVADALELIVADSGNQASIDAFVARSRVVLSTAGPFALYGTPVVDACVRFGTHYADITGETPWIREMIDRYHARASADGTRIVMCCGFDSVPADIGTLTVVRALRDAGTGTRDVRAYYRGTGGFNGGTVASMANVYATQGGASQVGAPRGARLADPFLLDPPVEHSPRQKSESRDVVTPFEDPGTGAWVGPFLMAVINTRVVRRSAALAAERGAPYGSDFVYQEYQRYGGGPIAAVKAVAITALLGVVDAAFRTSLGRQLFTTLLQPGAGPSKESMDKGWFRTDLHGTGEDGRVVRCTIHHKGDPGNRATVRFLCESALALATASEALPPGGGVLTPATALGDVLVRRLRAAGLEITVA
ncbi:MAG: saccharopine dehydrogenase family protein [Gemmatimonadaceae bacterium]